MTGKKISHHYISSGQASFLTRECPKGISQSYHWGVDICKWITHSIKSGSSSVQETLLPKMKTTYHCCCWSVLWNNLSVHLLTPPHERTLGIVLSGITFAMETSTVLTVEFISSDGLLQPCSINFTLYAMSISIISIAGMA